MPLVRVTIGKGRSAAEKRSILDGIHDALVETANVPRDDRFQTLQEVEPEGFVFDPGYLGFSRTGRVVFVQIFMNVGRTLEVKKALYAAIARNLGAGAGLRPDDLLVNLVEVARENWSFGGGAMSYPPAP
jgi:phenylpyruvate tautomerase PptA (4-oxalocrotonate tautomerase family)